MLTFSVRFKSSPAPTPPVAPTQGTTSPTKTVLTWPASQGEGITYDVVQSILNADGVATSTTTIALGITSPMLTVTTGIASTTMTYQVIAHNSRGLTVVGDTITITYPDYAAGGGTVVDFNGYRNHVFTGNGVFIPATAPMPVEVIVCGGGGGGGAGLFWRLYSDGFGADQLCQGGGGGGGEVIHQLITINTPDIIPITVGDGGAGGYQNGLNNRGDGLPSMIGFDGGKSSFGNLIQARGGNKEE